MGLHLDAEESFCKGSTEPPPQRNGFHPCSSSEAVHSSGNGVVLPLSLQGRAETIPAGGQTSLAERLNEAGSGFLAEASHVQPPKPTGNVQQSSSGPAKGGREPVRRSHVPAEPLQLPDTVEVVCGTTLGVLQLKKLRVSFDGKEMSCTEFERISGKEKAKKWKWSLRVVENGRVGASIDLWLKKKGWAILHDSIVLLSVAEQHHQQAARERARKAALQQAEAQPVLPEADEYGLPPIWKLISVPHDRSLGPVPKEVPPHPEPSASEPDVVHYDVRKMSYEELMALSAQSCENPLEDLLDEQPGIFPVNMAFLTGHKPTRVSVVGKEDAAVQLAQYLRGELTELPWSTLGVSRAPIVAGQYLELRLLYQAVQGFGGYDEVCREKQWDNVLAALGMGTPGSTSSHVKSILRTHYKRFLLQHERQERAFSNVKQPRTRGQRSETERAKGVAGSGAGPLDVAEGDGEHEGGDPSERGISDGRQMGEDLVGAVPKGDGLKIEAEVKLEEGVERVMDEGEEVQRSDDGVINLDDYEEEEEEEGRGEAGVDDDGGGKEEGDSDGDTDMDDAMDTEDDEEEDEEEEHQEGYDDGGEGPMEESSDAGEGAEACKRSGSVQDDSIDLVSMDSSVLESDKVQEVEQCGHAGEVNPGLSEEEKQQRMLQLVLER